MCTGESAARTVRAALHQFELCFKTSAPATLLVFRFVEEEKKVYDICQVAAQEDALLVYTLVSWFWGDFAVCVSQHICTHLSSRQDKAHERETFFLFCWFFCLSDAKDEQFVIHS